MNNNVCNDSEYKTFETECVNLTLLIQVKAVTVCVTDTGTVYLVSVFVTWRGEGHCVRYRAVRVSTTTVPSTAPVTVPPRCAPVIQVKPLYTLLPVLDSFYLFEIL